MFGSDTAFTRGDIAVGLALCSFVGAALFIVAVPQDGNFTRVSLPRLSSSASPALPPEAPTSPDEEALPAEIEEPAPEVLAAVEESSAVANGQTDLPAAPVPAPIARTANGMIASSFDLASPGSGNERVSGEAIVVRKVLRFGKSEIGSAPIHVDGQSRLLIDTGELAKVLRTAGIDSELGSKASGLATFPDLRRRGIDLRYDPQSDTINVTVS